MRLPSSCSAKGRADENPQVLAGHRVTAIFLWRCPACLCAADDSGGIYREFRLLAPCCKLLQENDLGQLFGPRRALGEK